MSGIMLGNLTVEQMQERSGVDFPQELIDLLKDTHQPSATNIQAGKWHCFDIPFMLVCGDMELAQSIYDYLKPFHSDFKESMQIGLS